MKRAAFFVLVGFLAQNCAESDSVDIAYVRTIEHHRQQKDQDYKSNHSPIPDENLNQFQGLSYFDVDPDYRLFVDMIRYDHPDSFDLITSQGEQRPAIRYGKVRFTLQKRQQDLQVYQLLDIREQYPNHLFLPFLDKTSGQETYGGGRYVELEADSSVAGRYILDFNLAYNPLCAYGRTIYRCPVPPQENRLDIAVRAGEKGWAH